MSKSFKARNYIEARSPRRLRFLMYQKQIQLGMAALEFDVTFSKGKWYAWYYEIIKDETLTEIINGNTEDNRR